MHLSINTRGQGQYALSFFCDGVGNFGNTCTSCVGIQQVCLWLLDVGLVVYGVGVHTKVWTELEQCIVTHRVTTL